MIDWLEKSINVIFALTPRSQPKKEQIQKALLIAHRGAHKNHLGIFENTLDAFRIAKQAGCWGLELDIHATRDQILVVNHDPNLMRLWGQNKSIAALSFQELRALVPQVPSLEEVVQEFGGALHLFIELKMASIDEQVLGDTLKMLKPSQDYHLLTLDPLLTAHLSSFPKTSILLVPVHHNVKSFCDLCLREGYGGVLGSYLLLTKKQLGLLKDAHKIYGVGFVESKNSLYRELGRGISWIFTNEVVKLGQILRHLKN